MDMMCWCGLAWLIFLAVFIPDMAKFLKYLLDKYKLMKLKRGIKELQKQLVDKEKEKNMLSRLEIAVNGLPIIQYLVRPGLQLFELLPIPVPENPHQQPLAQAEVYQVTVEGWPGQEHRLLLAQAGQETTIGDLVDHLTKKFPHGLDPEKVNLICTSGLEWWVPLENSDRIQDLRSYINLLQLVRLETVPEEKIRECRDSRCLGAQSH